MDQILDYTAAELLKTFMRLKKVCQRGDGLPAKPWDSYVGWRKIATAMINMSASVQNVEDYMMAQGRHKLKTFMPHEFARELYSADFQTWLAFQNNKQPGEEGVTTALDGSFLPHDARASATKFQVEFKLAMETITDYAGTTDMKSPEAFKVFNMPYIPVPAHYLVLLADAFPSIKERYIVDAATYWAAHPLEAAHVAAYLGMTKQQLIGIPHYAEKQPGT